ncbi:DUF5688 family protein [Anaerostipes faecalis]|uniref:DUF5688 family protein n=1 Tax=Anaerostipes faecalis TaxID=2738446 RepID=UPI001C1E0BCA|nr:DUF5688 family protein [Anaerostipes faecalis]
MQKNQGLIQNKCPKSIEKNIIYHLINYNKNRKILEKLPHIHYEDLAIVFRFVQKKVGQINSVLIDCKMTEEWKMDEKDLWRCAKKNTPEMFPEKIESINEMFHRHKKNEEPALILSNQQGLYGAGVILYEDILKNLADRYGWNLFLLPISIHEAMILFDRGQYVQEELLKIIQISNQTVVSENNFLSDNVYYYDRLDHELFCLF